MTASPPRYRRGRPVPIPQGLASERALWTRDRVEAVLRVSEATSSSQLRDLLDLIAQDACRVTTADASRIILASPNGILRVAAHWGHSQQYAEYLENPKSDVGSVARQAVDEGVPIVVENILSSRGLTDMGGLERRRMALRDGFSTMLAIPLVAPEMNLGTLILLRRAVGPWSDDDLETVTLFAQHATIAIEQTRLVDDRRLQLEALERLIGVLRDQTHEHANRLHAVSGLLALDRTQEANQFLARLISLHHKGYAAVIERVHNPALAAVLMGEMNVAHQRGVAITLHGATRVRATNGVAHRPEAVTVVANLLEHAVESVVGGDSRRRRVSIRLSDTHGDLRVFVRHWGGADGDRSPLATLLDGVRGTLQVEPLAIGSRLSVTLTND